MRAKVGREKSGIRGSSYLNPVALKAGGGAGAEPNAGAEGDAAVVVVFCAGIGKPLKGELELVAAESAGAALLAAAATLLSASYG